MECLRLLNLQRFVLCCFVYYYCYYFFFRFFFILLFFGLNWWWCVFVGASNQPYSAAQSSTTYYQCCESLYWRRQIVCRLRWRLHSIVTIYLFFYIMFQMDCLRWLTTMKPIVCVNRWFQGKLAREYAVHRGEVLCIEKDGDTLFSGGSDQAVRVWCTVWAHD